MNKEDEEILQEYPTPRASFAAFTLSLVLVVIIGSVLQFYAFLPGLYVTEWLLILGPPLVLLWRSKVSIKKSLGLQHFNVNPVLLGVVGGLGIYFVVLGLSYVMEGLLGPYPEVDIIEEAFPTTWLSFIPWILALGFSAGVCEEILFRGFIQKGLHNYWGPLKAVVVTALLFGVFHLDPWRIPSAVLLGLFAGYLVVRTGSLYSAIVLHMTSNTFGQVLAFADKLPKNSVQWQLALAVALVLVFIVLVTAEKTKK